MNDVILGVLPTYEHLTDKEGNLVLLTVSERDPTNHDITYTTDLWHNAETKKSFRAVQGNYTTYRHACLAPEWVEVNLDDCIDNWRQYVRRVR